MAALLLFQPGFFPKLTIPKIFILIKSHLVLLKGFGSILKLKIVQNHSFLKV